MNTDETQNEDKPITFKHLLSVGFFTALVVSILFNATYFGYMLKQDIKEKKTNDSLTIVKLKLEIELKKMEISKKTY